MAGEVYGYIIGLVITGIIFISAVAVVPNLSYVNLLYVDQQQLRNTALETMKAILLQAGSPASWGSEDPFNQDSVSRFGLACAESSSSYVLDSDKVQRLVVDNPIGYVEYDKMRELLGLEGYGFSICILPPFNVTIEELDFEPPDLEFEVKVSDNYGTPVPNAIVDSTIIYSTQEGVNSTLHVTIAETAFTGDLGTCKVNETLNPSEGISDIIVVFEVTVADLATIFVTYQKNPPEDIANVNLVGDNLILTVPDATPRGARWVDNLVMYGEEKLTFLYNGTRSNEDKLTYGEGYKVWTESFNDLKYHNPTLLIFNFFAVDPGPSARREILVAGPYPNWMGSRVIQYGGALEHAGKTAVNLHRTVIISGMTYIVELTLWKERSK